MEYLPGIPRVVLDRDFLRRDHISHLPLTSSFPALSFSREPDFPLFEMLTVHLNPLSGGGKD